MTAKGQAYPIRVPCRFQAKDGQVVHDQIRTMDHIRLVKRLSRRLHPQNSARAAGGVARNMLAVEADRLGSLGTR